MSKDSLIAHHVGTITLNTVGKSSNKWNYRNSSYNHNNEIGQVLWLWDYGTNSATLPPSFCNEKKTVKICSDKALIESYGNWRGKRHDEEHAPCFKNLAISLPWVLAVPAITEISECFGGEANIVNSQNFITSVFVTMWIDSIDKYSDYLKESHEHFISNWHLLGKYESPT